MPEQITYSSFEYPLSDARWAHTAKNTPIAIFSSHPLKEMRGTKPILLIGGVHGDEPEGVELAEKTLQWLKSENPARLHPWVLIPCINPDGYSLGERTNSNGVDLNRNYPTKCWVPEHSKPRYFPGSEPGSELETQAMVRLVDLIQPRLMIHCHSWEPCVVYTGEAGKPYAQKLADVSGYSCQPTIGYDCPGSFGDFGANERNTPVICIEAEHGCDITTVWPRFAQGLQWIFTKADH